MADTTDDRAISLNLTVEPDSLTNLLGLFKQVIEAALAKTVARIPVSPVAIPASKPESPPSTRSTGLELKATDKIKAADVRIALLTGKLPEDTGLLIDPKAFAALLDISTATLYRLHAEEAIPAPVQLGRLKKWRLAEILEWIEADCPPQQMWVQMKQASLRRKGR